MQHAHPPSSRTRRRLASAAFVLAFVASAARADDAMQWLTRAAQAARELNYIGTILYQIGPRVETSHITHLNDSGREFEKLVNLDGPARELIRTHGEVRCYYPDAKLVRVEPRTFRNVFPSLSPQQQQSLSRFYDFRVIGDDRVSGRPVQVGCRNRTAAQGASPEREGGGHRAVRVHRHIDQRPGRSIDGRAVVARYSEGLAGA